MPVVNAISATCICELKDLSPDVVVTKQGKIIPLDYIVKEGDVIEMYKLAISQKK